MKYAVVAVLNDCSSGRNPTFLIAPEDYATLRDRLSGPPAPGRDPSSFWLGCFILTPVGGVPGLPEQMLVDRDAVCLIDAAGVNARSASPGFYDWLLDLADFAGFAERTRPLRVR